MGTVRYIVRRGARMIVSLVIISVITFGLLQLAPGDFASIQSASSGSTGMASGQTEQVAAEFGQRYGSDVPVWEQYLRFMAGVVTWDMGPSYKYPSQSVEDLIAQGFPVSASLAVLAVVCALVIAIPLGSFAAVRQNTKWDGSTMFLLTLFHALPGYLIAAFLVVIFAGTLRVLPAAGWSGPQNMVLPVIALALPPTAVLARYVRSSMLETLREEYITAAYAKGGRTRSVVIGHALRNSLIPLVTVVGPMLATLMTGTVFIETMFRIPGLGLTFTQAAASRDMPLLMGTTLLIAIILMVVNLVVDLLYGVIDPRIRVGKEGDHHGRGSKRKRDIAGDTTGEPVPTSVG
jgi:peptide/nickel transport system permease protein